MIDGLVNFDSESKFTFPNVEDIYDLELPALNELKERIEMTINVNLIDDREDQDEIDDMNFRSIINFASLNEGRLKKLYKFLIAEIKERNSFEEVLNFFQDKNAYEKMSTSLYEKGFKSNLNDPISTKENSVKDDSSKNIKIKAPKLDIKALLRKTKIEDGSKFIVGQSTYTRNVRTAPVNKIQIEDKKKSNSANTLRTLPSILSPKTPNEKITYNLVIKNNNLKKPILKTKKTLSNGNSKKTIEKTEKTFSNLDIRRNYIVPLIKPPIKVIKSSKNMIKITLNDDLKNTSSLRTIFYNKDIENVIVKNENEEDLVNIEEQNLKTEEDNSIKVDLLINNKTTIQSEKESIEKPINLCIQKITENDFCLNTSNKYNDLHIDIVNSNFSNKPVDLKRNFNFDFTKQIESKKTKVYSFDNIDVNEIIKENLEDSHEEFCESERNALDNKLESQNKVDKELFTPLENLIIENKNENLINTKVDFDSLKKIVEDNGGYIGNNDGSNSNCTIVSSGNTPTSLPIFSNLNSRPLSKGEMLNNTKESFFSNFNNTTFKMLETGFIRNLKNNQNNNNNNNNTNSITHNNTSNFNQTNSTTFRITNFPNNKHNSATTKNFYTFNQLNQTKIISKDRKKSAQPTLKINNKFISKMPLFKHINNQSSAHLNIPNYSKIYKSFEEIFNGFFISCDYNNKHFDLAANMSILYNSFKSLDHLENSDTMEKVDKMNSKILEAEAEVIKNRLRQVSDKLLTDRESLSGERYYVFKKVLELQKKEYGKKREINEECNNTQENVINKMYFRVVLSRPEIYDIMCYTLGLRSEWTELPHGLLLGNCWNLLWTYSTPNIDMTKVFSFQKINHLVNNRVIGRKDLLKKSIDRVRKINNKLNNLFNIMPTTFILSRDYAEFVEEFTLNKNSGINPAHNLWIVKPVGKSRGRGIFVINDISEVPVSESYLVQKYLTNPLLIDEHKFDMRIYVLVTSVNPLEAFIYKDGFARISNQPFSLNDNNRLIHLTNAAVQNKHAFQKRNENYEKMYGGSKISLDMLKNKLSDKGINFEKQIWNQVRDIVLKSLVACQHDMPFSPSTFELFGYDIIIDSNLKCWLLEVNTSPSLERSNVLDDQIKLELVDDILNLVDPINFDKKKLLEVLERRMNMNHSVSSNVYLYSASVQLNLDLNQIFGGKVPRAYGEIPEKMGNFEIIAPSDESSKLIKLSGGQKYFADKNKQ